MIIVYKCFSLREHPLFCALYEVNRNERSSRQPVSQRLKLQKAIQLNQHFYDVKIRYHNRNVEPEVQLEVVPEVQPEVVPEVQPEIVPEVQLGVRLYRY